MGVGESIQGWGGVGGGGVGRAGTSIGSRGWGRSQGRGIFEKEEVLNAACCRVGVGARE